MKRRLVPLFFVLTLTTPLAFSQITIDGTRDAAYGAPLIVQDTQTGFGDNDDPNVDVANGSELDAAYAVVEDCTLYLFLSGNFADYNKTEIFFDSQAGGQNQLRGDNPWDALNRMGFVDPNQPGLKFDVGANPDEPVFAADFWLGLNIGADGDTFAGWVDYAEVKPVAEGGVGYYVGKASPASDGTLTETTPGAFDIRMTFDNSNWADPNDVNSGGVVGGSAPHFFPDPALVTTGVEMAIPLAAIGLPAGDFKISLFINGVNHDFMSNQVLGGVFGEAIQGTDPRVMDFDVVGGNQFFTVTNTEPCGACCVGETCAVTTAADCIDGIHSPGVSCSPNPCLIIPEGACCIDGTCSVLTADDCTTAGGEYLGDDTLCTPGICDTGSCCVGQECTPDVRQAVCVNDLGGTWNGAGSTCDPSPCRTVACCINGYCFEISEAYCASQNGTYDSQIISCAGDPCGTPADHPMIDGTLTGDSYGSSLAVQDTQTSYGDNSDASVAVANGSELNAAYAKISDGVLFLTFTGNLESNFNKLQVFFDTRPGGQNPLSADPNDNAGVDFGALQNLGGLTFDADFGADYYFNVNNGGDGPTVYANFVELGDPNLGYYLGQGSTADASDKGLLGFGTNPFGILVTMDNSNIAGVLGGSGLVDDDPGDGENPGEVTTGVELVMPLSALGNPAGDIKVTAIIGNSGHDHFSSQVLAPLTGQGLDDFWQLGDPTMVDFSALANPQYFVVPNAAPTGACCDFLTYACTITTEAACTGTFQGVGTTCDPTPCLCAGDMDCDGDVDFDDITPFVVAIGDDGSDWAAWYANNIGGTPPCEFLNGDGDGDGDIDFDDITPFVDAIGDDCAQQ